jgi:hypothetical protein
MENNMTCATSVLEMNAQMLYKCSTTLTGLNDKTNNGFYFRCEDQPALKGTSKESQRNVNEQSYYFVLVGTQPLVIDKAGPNGTIKDSTDVIKVDLNATTSAGYKNGEATCQFSNTGAEGSYINFFSTGSYYHEQELHLSAGDYTYYIKCFDLGGNTDYANVSFTVETDTSPPQAVRVYHDEPYLKVITDEDSECVYNTQDNIGCGYSFDDGNSMTDISSREHEIDWNTLLTFYIKCRDQYGNEPLPNQCTIIARPFSL